MKFYNRFLQPLFFSKRLYWVFTGIIIFFLLSFGVPYLFFFAKLVLLVFGILLLLDYGILFFKYEPVHIERITSDRFSNGDENKVELFIVNKYPFRISTSIIDEIPEQFQVRNFLLKIEVVSGEKKSITYFLRPAERGEYHFNAILLFVKSPLQLIVRRVTKNTEQVVKVLPSFFLLRQFELKAHSSNLTEAGSKKIRKIGHSLEFEQIKDYVTGDDIRSINWKATARKGQLMVNNFTDERSQQIYCIIDKGRVMKMPFKGLSLLDYAINASLMLLRVALIKQD